MVVSHTTEWESCKRGKCARTRCPITVALMVVCPSPILITALLIFSTGVDPLSSSVGDVHPKYSLNGNRLFSSSMLLIVANFFRYQNFWNR